MRAFFHCHCERSAAISVGRVGLRSLFRVKRRSSSSGFCSCLIHQAQLPNKLGNYIFKCASQPLPLLAMTRGCVIASPFLPVIASRRRGNLGGARDCGACSEPSSPVIASVAWQSRRGMGGFCSCLIHQAQLPNKLGNYIAAKSPFRKGGLRGICLAIPNFKP